MFSLLLLMSAAAAPASESAFLQYSVPEEVTACLESEQGYAVDPGVNPFYLRGDIDDDGWFDYVAAVTHGGQRGILVCWGGGDRKPTALGAGHWFLKMKDLTFAGWRIHPRSVKVTQGEGEGRPPKLHGDVFVLRLEERPSVVIYWTGEQFRWYEQGEQEEAR